MQKIISVNVIKPMLLVIKAKANAQLEKATKEQIEINKRAFFKQNTDHEEIKKDLKETFKFSSIFSFIQDLEVCCKNTGDLILSANEVEYLNTLYEKEL